MEGNDTKSRSSVQELQKLLRKSCRSPFSKCDQVYPGIYLGGLEASQDTEFLSLYGITHILNAAFDEFGDNILHVKTNEEYYAKKNFKCEFMGVAALDENDFQLHLFFDGAAEFIDKALAFDGKVLVHCFMGVSRSATLVIAYLMIKKNMSAAEALKLVRSKRDIFPNDGFIQQLCDLETRLLDKSSK